MIAKSRGFMSILGGVVAAALALRLAISFREWFVTDDFYLLNLIQSPRWDWAEVFLPTRERPIAAYRPLGRETYFYLAFAAFGWNAAGYYLSGLALQALTALAVFRIAILEEYDKRVAWVAAAIAATGGQSLIASYAVAEHSYLCSALGYAASIMWFLEYLKTRRARYQVFGSAALACGVLSNDACVTMPALAFGVAFLRATPAAPAYVPDSGLTARLQSWDLPSRALQAIARTLPQFLIVFLYGDFRAWGVPLRQQSGFSEVDVSADMAKNTLGNLENAFGGGAGLFGLALLLGAAVWSLRAGRAPQLIQPMVRRPRAFVPLVWLVLGYLPFAVLALPATRFSLAQLPAAALCAGLLCELIVGRLRNTALQNVALLAVLCLCVPWDRAIVRLLHPKSPELREAYELARRTLPSQDRDCVIVHYGGDGLANTDEGVRFRHLTFSGALFRAVVPRRPLDVEFDDERLDMRAYTRLADRACVEYELRPSRILVQRELPSDARAELTQPN